MTTRHSPSACPAPVAPLPTWGSAQTLTFSMPIDSATSAGSTTQLRVLTSAPTSELTVRLVELVGLLRLPAAPTLAARRGSCLCSVRSFGEGMDVAANPTNGTLATRSRGPWI